MAHKGAAADPSGPVAQKTSADDHTEVDELGYDPASSPVLCASFACLARYYVDSLSEPGRRGSRRRRRGEREEEEENPEKETETEGTARQAEPPRTGRGEATGQEGDAGGMMTVIIMGAE